MGRGPEPRDGAPRHPGRAPDPDRRDGPADPRPLAGIRVLDVTDELGAYGTSLLALLGADVVRVDPPGGCRVDQGPYLDAARTVSLFREFVNRGKRAVLALDPDAPLDRARLEALCASAEAVVWSSQLGAADPWLAVLRGAADPARQVLTLISPFGLSGPYAGRRGSDATVLALGGFLSLSGYPDMPVVPPDKQACMAASLHGAFGTAVALRHLLRTGEGQLVEVAALAAVAQALENAVQYVDLEGVVRGRRGEERDDAATGVFRCADGHVLLITCLHDGLLRWTEAARWLVEEGPPEASELLGDRWLDPVFRRTPEAMDRFRALFEGFAGGRGKVALSDEGQRRGVNVAPLNAPSDVVADGHLRSRGFWYETSSPYAGRTLRYPGAPFLLDGVRPVPSGSPATLDGTAARALAPWTPRPTPPAPGRPGAARSGVAGSGVAPAPAALPARTGPLADLRVADFTWVGVGPFATRFLADLGADVVRIESSAHPDPIRAMRPKRPGVEDPDASGYFANRNPSKRSVAIDLRTGEGRALARRLVERSDVVINNFSPGVLDRFALGAAELRAGRPGLVYVDMPMMGLSGPSRAMRGYGQMMNALSGLYALTALPGRAPSGTGTNYPDHVPNPLHTALAVVAALVRRDRTGAGAHVEVAQLESALGILGPTLLQQLNGEEAPRAAGNEGRWPELQSVRREADGGHLAVSLADWGRAADADGQAVGRVQSAAEVLADPQLAHLGHWVTLEHPTMGRCLYDGPVARLSRTPAVLRRPAPRFGEHTAEVLAEWLDLADDEIARLARAGVLR